MPLDKPSTAAEKQIDEKQHQTPAPAPKATPQTLSDILEMGAIDIRAALATGQIVHSCESLNHPGSRMSVITSFVVCPQELEEELQKRLTAVVGDFFERCGITGVLEDTQTVQ